jgi:hypothetical protein|tara:strand:- start:1173 stop:1388 length:216 start_codon:yes stop_codon:yes gene_type:complete
MPARRQILAEQALARQKKKLIALQTILKVLENIRPKLDESDADAKKLFKILKYVGRELEITAHNCTVILNS